MDDHDEQLLRGRVYGAEHDDPGPRAGRTYRELCGGPLDGLLLDVTGWDAEQLADGAALSTHLSRYGDTGRSHYEPRPGDPQRWEHVGDTP
ncbi:hypothetical protein ACFV1L_28420 [Kitasatospora sp. NPDC059646]|uniref:hypothetical protein n=1 Tax=Kitasatospora sp. NPDC059646 TaxID=3346893 RepID=UPI0036C6497E